MTQDPWGKVVATFRRKWMPLRSSSFPRFLVSSGPLAKRERRSALSRLAPGISWDKVGQAFSGKFYQLVKADAEASRIIADPPNAIENLAGLGLRFNATPPHCCDASAVFHALARIRNNFFHGWKTGLEADDLQHIAEGNAVLRIAYEYCDNHPGFK